MGAAQSWCLPDTAPKTVVQSLHNYSFTSEYPEPTNLFAHCGHGGGSSSSTTAHAPGCDPLSESAFTDCTGGRDRDNSAPNGIGGIEEVTYMLEARADMVQVSPRESRPDGDQLLECVHRTPEEIEFERRKMEVLAASPDAIVTGSIGGMSRHPADPVLEEKDLKTARLSTELSLRTTMADDRRN
mmetsp:Transcript_42175/g.98941  ORF Transcript_42175/g.98941 Transcript_42175/m.98941 type:complete len:185 (-) Transcript_42175:6-560(-)